MYVKSSFFLVVGLPVIFIFQHLFSIVKVYYFYSKKINEISLLLQALASENPSLYRINFSLDSFSVWASFIELIGVWPLWELSVHVRLSPQLDWSFWSVVTHITQHKWITLNRCYDIFCCTESNELLEPLSSESESHKSVYPVLKHRVHNWKPWCWVAIQTWKEINWISRLSELLQFPCQVSSVSFHFV